MTHQTTHHLTAQTRVATKKKVKELRQQGIVPAVVYGHKKTNQNIQIDLRALEKAYAVSGESSLIDLSIDDQSPCSVIINEMARDQLTDTITHVDFYMVNMKEMIHTQVALQFTGEAPAVKALGGVLVKNKDHINIKCLPQDLVKEMAVDITGLKTFTNAIHIRDVHFMPGIEVLDNVEEVVVLVTPPRSDEELAALNEKVTEDVTAVEGVTKPAETATPETTTEPVSETKTKK